MHSQNKQKKASHKIVCLTQEYQNTAKRAEEILPSLRGASTSRRNQILDAIYEAHIYGELQPGKNGAPAAVGNYTTQQIYQKRRILEAARLHASEVRAAFETGLVGKEDSFKAVITEYLKDPKGYFEKRFPLVRTSGGELTRTAEFGSQKEYLPFLEEEGNSFYRAKLRIEARAPEDLARIEDGYRKVARAYEEARARALLVGALGEEISPAECAMLKHATSLEISDFKNHLEFPYQHYFLTDPNNPLKEYKRLLGLDAIETVDFALVKKLLEEARKAK
jgi:hypothetical protein